MAQQQRTPSVVARDFKGIVVNADPHDLEAGVAQDMMNLKCDEKGRMSTRDGFSVVSFDYQA